MLEMRNIQKRLDISRKRSYFRKKNGTCIKNKNHQYYIHIYCFEDKIKADIDQNDVKFL